MTTSNPLTWGLFLPWARGNRFTGLMQWFQSSHLRLISATRNKKPFLSKTWKFQSSHLRLISATDVIPHCINPERYNFNPLTWGLFQLRKLWLKPCMKLAGISILSLEAYFSYERTMNSGKNVYKDFNPLTWGLFQLLSRNDIKIIGRWWFQSSHLRLISATHEEINMEIDRLHWFQSSHLRLISATANFGCTSDTEILFQSSHLRLISATGDMYLSQLAEELFQSSHLRLISATIRKIFFYINKIKISILSLEAYFSYSWLDLREFWTMNISILSLEAYFSYFLIPPTQSKLEKVFQSSHLRLISATKQEKSPERCLLKISILSLEAYFSYQRSTRRWIHMRSNFNPLTWGLFQLLRKMGELNNFSGLFQSSHLRLISATLKKLLLLKDQNIKFQSSHLRLISATFFYFDKGLDDANISILSLEAYFSYKIAWPISCWTYSISILSLEAYFSYIPEGFNWYKVNENFNPLTWGLFQLPNFFSPIFWLVILISILSLEAYFSYSFLVERRKKQQMNISILSLEAYFSYYYYIDILQSFLLISILSLEAYFSYLPFWNHVCQIRYGISILSLEAYFSYLTSIISKTISILYFNPLTWGLFQLHYWERMKRANKQSISILSLEAYFSYVKIIPHRSGIRCNFNPLTWGLFQLLRAILSGLFANLAISILSLEAYFSYVEVIHVIQKKIVYFNPLTWGLFQLPWGRYWRTRSSWRISILSLEAYFSYINKIYLLNFVDIDFNPLTWGLFQLRWWGSAWDAGV